MPGDREPEPVGLLDERVVAALLEHDQAAAGDAGGHGTIGGERRLRVVPPGAHEGGRGDLAQPRLVLQAADAGSPCPAG